MWTGEVDSMDVFVDKASGGSGGSSGLGRGGLKGTGAWFGKGIFVSVARGLFELSNGDFCTAFANIE